MNYNDLVESIFTGVGGKNNIANVWHCSTRLRFNIKNENAIDLEYLSKLPGVLRAQIASGQLQVVIGPQVSDVFKVLREKLGGLEQNPTDDASDNEPKKKKKVLDVLIETLSGIFTPIIPAIAGVGMLKGILALLTIFNVVNAESGSYLVFNIIADAGLYFLPFLLAVSTARKFNTSEYLALVVAGTLMYPSLIELANAGTQQFVKFFFLPVSVMNYANSVLPIILAVLLLRYVYDFFKKIVPNAITIVVTPTLTLFIVVIVTLTVIAPAGQLLGTYFATATAFLFDKAGLLMGAVIGGTFAPLVITGMMYGYMPIMFENFALYGYDTLLIPLSTVSNLAQAGATFAVAVKTKSKEVREVAISSGITALLGITEPAMYGITLKFKKPFVAALISASISGAFVGAMGVKAYSLAGDSLLALPGFLSGDGYMNLILMVIGVLISFVLSFVITLFLGLEEPNEDNDTVNQTTTSSGKSDKYIEIPSPVSGEVMNLENVPDTVFSDKLAGEGLAINSIDGIVKSPVNGTITSVLDSKHAIGILSDDGVEILIHIGLETISLGGEGFEMYVKEGDHVTLNQEIVKFDKEFIESKNLYSSVIMVVTNTSNYLDIFSEKIENITSGNKVLTIIK